MRDDASGRCQYRPYRLFHIVETDIALQSRNQQRGSCRQHRLVNARTLPEDEKVDLVLPPAQRLEEVAVPAQGRNLRYEQVARTAARPMDGRLRLGQLFARCEASSRQKSFDRLRLVACCAAKPGKAHPALCAKREGQCDDEDRDLMQGTLPCVNGCFWPRPRGSR